MRRGILLGIVVLFLCSCSDVVNPASFYAASAACKPHGGLKVVYAYDSGQYPSTPPTSYRARCVDGTYISGNISNVEQE